MSPHTVNEVADDNWRHQYSRQQAAFALPWIAENKFWPASSRVDNGYGDRNLMCICDSIENLM
jgi:glycine dehydrogenase